VAVVVHGHANEAELVEVALDRAVRALAQRRVHVAVVELHARRGIERVHLHEVLRGIGRGPQHLPAGVGRKVGGIEMVHLERDDQLARAVREERWTLN